MMKIKELINKKSFKARLAKGSIWLGIGGGADVGLKLIRNMLLARLIAPDDFGVMAIIIAANSLFEAFSQVGIKEAIIQSEHGNKREYLNSAWWFSVIRGVVLYIIGFVSAPFVADFYEMPELTFMLRIAFVSLLFVNLISVGAYKKLKQLHFMQWTSIFIGGSFIGVFTTIFLSFRIAGIWALIIGFIVEAFVKFLISHIICPFKPGFEFKKEYTQALIKFAKGMFGLPILAFIFMRTDIFVIGKLCTPAELGVYSLAVTLARMPNVIMEKFVAPLMMPAFSEIQKDNGKINRGIFQITFGLSLVGIPAIIFIFFNSEIILRLIYGKKYILAALPFAVLFMTNLLRSISQPLVAVYYSKGQPELHRVFTIIRALLLIIIIYPATKIWGYTGAAFAVSIAMIVSYVVQVYKLHSVTSMKLYEYYKILLESFLYSLPLIIWFSLSKYLFINDIVIKTIVNCIGFILIYLILIYKHIIPLIKRRKAGG